MPPGLLSHSPPQQQVMCGPLPGSRAQHAELLPRGELQVPMPSCSHCREAPRQFTLQAVLGLLLQWVWSCCHCSWCSACAEPELPLRLSASMLPTRSRTHWAVSLGTNCKVFPLWESSLRSLSAILNMPAGAVHLGGCREVISLGNL